MSKTVHAAGKTAPKAKRVKTSAGPNVAEDVMQGLGELEELMAMGAPPKSRFTIRTVEHLEGPGEYGPRSEISQ